jgi:hypothetical protein
VRWLLQARDIQPLYTLTDPTHPEPSGNRLALHEGEGDTAQVVAGAGVVGDITPTSGRSGTRPPIWPALLAGATALFLLDRGLAAGLPRRWQ